MKDGQQLEREAKIEQAEGEEEKRAEEEGEEEEEDDKDAMLCFGCSYHWIGCFARSLHKRTTESRGHGDGDGSRERREEKRRERRGRQDEETTMAKEEDRQRAPPDKKKRNDFSFLLLSPSHLQLRVPTRTRASIFFLSPGFIKQHK